MASAVIALADPDDIEYFASIPEDNLTSLHSTLGFLIRKEFNLWQYGWTPEIDERGVDCSSAHPDQVSMAVIKLAHMMVKGDKMKREQDWGLN
jgi:hypothetical protein